MTSEQLRSLRESSKADLQTIRELLSKYRATGDQEMANFVESYSRSLELDLELAAAEGETKALELITEDVRILRDDTLLRVETERVFRRNTGGSATLLS